MVRFGVVLMVEELTFFVGTGWACLKKFLLFNLEVLIKWYVL